MAPKGWVVGISGNKTSFFLSFFFFFFLFCPYPSLLYITRTYLYNFDPFKPHSYIVKLGFTGVYIIFLVSARGRGVWMLVGTASARRF